MKKTFIGAALVGALATALPARAVDPWEGGYINDDGVSASGLTSNTLSPGLAQVHDLDEQISQGNDQDWATVPTVRYHSYEARVSGYNADFQVGTFCPGCAQFEVVDQAGVIFMDDVGVVSAGPGFGNGQANDRSVRWFAGETANSSLRFARVRGSADLENASYVYTLRYWDTTYRVPRWNAANGQTTVVVLTSMAQAAVTARLQFFGEDGSLLWVHPVTLSRNSPVVVSTGSLLVLAGRSGYALVAHSGGYGALTGKAVSVDPATGFTFDTALEAIPQ